ncbi:hypothetical protein Tco_1304063 [Tanacetum coccineum]
MSPGLSARVTEVMTLSDSAFRKRYRSSYKTPSPSPSLPLLAEGTGLGSEESEDEGPDSEGEEAAPEGQQQAVQVTDTAVDEPLRLGYRTSRRLALESTEKIAPIVPSPIASPVTTPAATIAVDDDEFLEVGEQLELYGSILHDHTQRLDALPPVLFEGYYGNLRELYTRSRAHAAMQRALQEMKDCVTTLEQERSRRGQ